jgi:hypothetical protein
MSEVVDQRYLPFSASQLRQHCPSDPDGHIKPFLDSAERYHEFLNDHPDCKGVPLHESRFPCQIEKDERFWTATALMTFYHSAERDANLAELLRRAFGASPPIGGMDSWGDCLAGRLHLFLEAVLPSPVGYRDWLGQHVRERHLIPYVLRACDPALGKALEGPTHVDALLLNEDNGFAVMFEAKALSDISCQVSFDARRNQIVRNVDVMLERNGDLVSPLNRRDPDRTLFVLLTPEVFRANPHSRLYGWLLRDYQNNPHSLARDLPHRERTDWESVSRRLGWLTWEDCATLLPKTCPWLCLPE